MTMALQVVLSGLVARTHGLTSHGLPELEVSVKDASLLPDAQRFLSNMGEALQQGTIHLHPGETVQCGYWIVKFDAKSPGLLSATEPNAENTEFVPGADLALSYRRDQKRVCREQGASFEPPNPLSLIACSDGLREGRSPIGGTRYRHSGKMSGWFLSTDLYDGTNNTVKLHHAYHVTAARPELVNYLALPPGYRFDHGESPKIWFDATLEAEESW